LRYLYVVLNLFCSKAQVTVVLKNRGFSAYKPEVFGKNITIVRTFIKNGSSSYRLLSEQGKTISTRKADLVDICDHMDIQVDNPVSVLTQGIASVFWEHYSS
jgi:structural maintenance of chromosomes protein 6